MKKLLSSYESHIGFGKEYYVLAKHTTYSRHDNTKVDWPVMELKTFELKVVKFPRENI